MYCTCKICFKPKNVPANNVTQNFLSYYNVSNANLSFGISCRFQANFFASSLQVDSVTPKVDTMSVFLSTLLEKSGTNSNGAFIPSEA